MESIDFTHPLYLHPLDTPGTVLVSHQLTRIENYNLCSRSIRIVLLVKNKLRFINSNCARDDFTELLKSQWDRCNTIILSWILNTVSADLSAGLVFASTAALVWKDLKERFNKVDGSRIFFLHLEIALFTQDSSSGSTPSVNRAYSIVVQDESQRYLSSGVSPLSDATVMYSNSSNLRRGRLNVFPPEFKFTKTKETSSAMVANSDQNDNHYESSPLTTPLARFLPRTSIIVCWSSSTKMFMILVMLLLPTLQDLFNGKIMGISKKQGGLYILQSFGSFLSDNGSKFFSKECSSLFSSFGIVHQYSFIDTPQQNVVFGCLGYATQTKPRDKLFPRAIPSIFMGYLDTQKDVSSTPSNPPNLYSQQSQSSPCHSVGAPVSPTLVSSRSSNVPVDHAVRSFYLISDHISYSHLPFHTQSFISSTSIVEPTSYSDAIKNPLWDTAMQEKIQALELNNTWCVVPLPLGKVPIGCKWVYKVKFRSNGEVERYKARLVTKGYNQRECVDFVESFSPVAKLVTLPQGFCSQRENMVCRLQKSIYGLKEGTNIVVMLIYVDDLLIIGNNAAMIEELKNVKLTSTDYDSGLIENGEKRIDDEVLQGEKEVFQRCQLTTFCDADWVACLMTRRSITGFCVKLGNSLISWNSKKHNTIARSSAEAEYISMAMVAVEIVWLRGLLIELGVKDLQPARLYCDSKAALQIATNPKETLGFDTLGPRGADPASTRLPTALAASAAATSQPKTPEDHIPAVHARLRGESPLVVRIKDIDPCVNCLIGKPSSMDKKCSNQIILNSEVRQWAEDLQRQEGDSLQDDYVSDLASYASVSLKRNDMQDLRNIWESWDSNKKLQFYQTYGDIPYLLYVEVDDELLRALVQFWNPGYNCFTFNKEDLVPTIEEYTTLLHLEGAVENRIYSKSIKTQPFRVKLAKIAGVREEWVASRTKQKGESEGIAWTNIKELIQSHPDIKVRFDLFALGIYGMVIFPKVLGYIEAAVIDLFEQLPKKINPVSAILAETFRSLNACRRLGGGRFSGCTQLLYVWIRSHFWRTEKVSYRRFNTDYSPLKEFLEQEWLKEIKKDMWINAFRNLQSNDIVWRAPWQIQREFFYKCGDYNWIMLLGLWGGIGYAPLLVIRQYEGRQFVPITAGLQSSEFAFHCKNYKRNIMEAVTAWKTTFCIRAKAAKEMLTPDYEEWRSVRKNENIPLPDQNEDISMEDRIKVVPSEIEILRAEFEAEREGWSKELEQMRQDKAMLGVDIDFHSSQCAMLRKDKEKGEDEYRALQKNYQELYKSRKSSGPSQSTVQMTRELNIEKRQVEDLKGKNNRLLKSLEKGKQKMEDFEVDRRERIIKHKAEHREIMNEMQREWDRAKDLEEMKNDIFVKFEGEKNSMFKGFESEMNQLIAELEVRGQKMEESNVEKEKWELERKNFNTRLEVEQEVASNWMQRCRNKDVQIQKLNQRTQEARTKLEEDLDQSRNKNSEFNAYILQLEESLFQEKVHLGPNDLKESNEENASLRRRIRDLEKILHNCQVRITELEQTLEGTNEQWQKSTEFYVERSEERSNMVFEAMVQMSEVARYVGELAVEAKIIEHQVDPVSKCGKKVSWLMKEIIELNRKATPYLQATKRIMDDKIQRIEEQHHKEQEEMRMKLEKIEASIANSQDSMMKKIEDMFKRQAISGKMQENPVSFDQDPMYPLGFPPEPIYHSGATPIQINARTSALQEAKPHEDQQVDPASSSKIPLISDVKVGDLNTDHLIPDLNELNEKQKANEELTRQIKSLEERMKSVEITESFYGFDASELSLVPDLILPIKFKAPEFDKYNGTTCPSSHITMFCRRMAGYVKDEKLLIHCFQDSLTGPALKWYTQLTKANIRSWKDLAKAFLEQYRHVTDMVPDRWTLQNLEKKNNETFRQYAQRWRDTAAQVQPPLSEKEATVMFVHTLKAPYLNHLMGNATRNFADLVISGELIENVLKSGKIESNDGSSSKRPTYRKKENEVNNANSYSKDSSKSVTITQPRVKKEETNTNRAESRGSRKENERLSFTPLPVPYSEIYDSLLKADVIRPYPLVPMQPPFPPWYDTKAHCVYHEGITGHSIENCLAFKRVVQNLINTGKLEFNTPSASSHPLPNHGVKNVNAIQEENRKKAKTDISEIKSPFVWIFQQLSLAGIIPQQFRPKQNEGKNYCEYHQEQGHKIQLCSEFRNLVQKLMNNREIEFFEEEPGRKENEVCSSEDSKPSQRINDPVIINVKSSTMIPAPIRPKVVITTPLPFPYKDTRRVPWNYTTNVSMIGGPVSLEKTKEKIQSLSTTSTSEAVSEVGFFTRSGRCYSPETSNASEQVKAKGKAVAIPQKVFEDESLPAFNEPVTEKQAQEFLKFLKHSEYSVVEQLHKQQARISILDLLMNSEAHRNALMKILNQTFIPEDISLNKLDRIVGHIAADNYITFTDDEIPEGGMGSVKALNITTHCHGHVLPGVLIDNGSALNLMPLVTLQRMPLDQSHMKSYQNVVRAFDGTQREVLGKMEIPLLIGPVVYNIDFVVMDIHPTYNCLLGRPWIHSAGAVPSSLHQKLKFVVDGQLICVSAEEEIIASVTSDVPYIDTNDEALECSFRALEFVNATFIAEGSKIPYPRLSDCTKMTVQQTLGIGAKAGKGLGKNLQGISVPVSIKMKKDRFGLGFKPNLQQRNKEMKRRCEDRKAKLKGGEILWKHMSFPQLKTTFRSGGTINVEQQLVEAFKEEKLTKDQDIVEEAMNGLFINMIMNDNKTGKYLDRIRPCLPGETLTNWTTEDLPIVFNINAECHRVNSMFIPKFNPVINLEQPICLEEINGCEDELECDVPTELLRLVEKEDKQILPHKEEVETVNLGTDEKIKEVKIGTTLTVQIKQELINLLQEFKDIFAWSYQDMPGLSTDIVIHKLPINPEYKPIQQKLRRMRPEMLLQIKEEVMKQINAGFLQASKYPEWVANIVPVPKKNGKVRMCVDYRDLNKASPKDSFPLPHIDTLVDNTAGHAWFSFMDGFSGYNQIKMNPEDMEKTTFITMWGTFCYKVMPFGLKNAGATYQRAMVTLFHDMMHKEIEVYVDDMIAKSRTEEEHIQNLRKLFQRLRKYQLKLNPAKCTFGVTSGKLLGFVVSKKGIEIDPDKVKAIQDLPPPNTKKEFLMESPALTGRMARWQMLLSEFDIVYVNQKAIKGSVIADFLASRVSNDYQPLNFNFPDEDLLCISMNEEVRTNDEFATWKLYFDGASNALGRGIGAVLISPENVYYPFTSRLEFFCTNNMAEYEACVMGLKAAIERKIKCLKIYGDSSLVVYQLRGEWETKDPKLLEYRNFTLELVKEFEKVTFNYLPREENQMADALATLAAMFQATKKVDMMPIKMQVYEIPAHCYSVEEEVDGKPWYHDILEARNVIEEVHSGICGTHANGLSMARKIMRYGYYWATMYTDCIDYARKCHKCQIYADKIHVPPSPLHVMTAPWPFSMWGIDVIGAITPKASNGHCFILVAIDYFTKWVEAASYTNIKRSTVCKFIKKEIISRYGLPERIITDNALNLNNKMMTELCAQFKIKHANSVAYRPKMNGAVEAANKNIKRIITKTTETYKDWHEKLPFALYAYRTTVRTSTGATPFSLVYGMEAVLPIEVEIPSLRILRETKLDESEWIQARVDQLNLIEEKRLKAICHGQMYQKRMMKSHDKKVHPREFQEGDLVLKKILPIHKDFRGKWMPNWEGPYVVKKAFSGGALILAEMDGKILKNPINSDSVKKYYA
ncbi:No pollen germination related 2 [Hibiscus syriacus]|uniref:No pollen germination related 2 n=1 Tax=Hibiscus syriacus TaxID=106335 RepID=A0A6A2WR20_HIBSY|nr:No pollen germination related 2 [Hibiscus syriacus]